MTDRERYSRLGNALACSVFLDGDRVMPDDEVLALLNQHSKLADCLGRLMDVQNGPPLPKYEKEWAEVMENAWKLLDGLEE